MADKPVGEVVAVDAVLDALVSPTSSDVYEALGPYSNDAAVASAATLALAGGGGSQPIRIEPVVLAYADFILDAGSGYYFAPAYALQADEVLLWTLGRVTEAFDDSSVSDPFLLYDGSNHDTSDVVGFTAGNLLPHLPTAANGIVSLNGDSVGSAVWASTDGPYMTETTAVQLYLATFFAGDGAAGSVTLWFYLGAVA